MASSSSNDIDDAVGGIPVFTGVFQRCGTCGEISHFTTQTQCYCDTCDTRSRFFKMETVKKIAAQQRLVYLSSIENPTADGTTGNYTVEDPESLRLILTILDQIVDVETIKLSFTILLGNQWLAHNFTYYLRDLVIRFGTAIGKFNFITLELNIFTSTESETSLFTSEDFYKNFFYGFVTKESGAVTELSMTLTPAFCDGGSIGLFRRFVKKAGVHKLNLTTETRNNTEENDSMLGNLLFDTQPENSFQSVRFLSIKDIPLNNYSCRILREFMHNVTLCGFTLDNCVFFQDADQVLVSPSWNRLFSLGVSKCKSLRHLTLENMHIQEKTGHSRSKEIVTFEKDCFLKEMVNLFLKNDHIITLSLKGFNIPFIGKDWNAFYSALVRSKFLQEPILFDNSIVRIPSNFLFKSSDYIRKINTVR